MNDKIRDYHEFGVDMIWVAEPETQTVRVFPKVGRHNNVEKFE
jgi:hypothetical protein